MRCKHGFEPDAVKCPVGCHGPAVTESREPETDAAARNMRTRAVSNAQIVAAIGECGTLDGAAASLGINPGTISNRARADASIREALEQRRRTQRHSGFLDLTGQELGGWTVLREVPSANGNSRWECQHHCGGGVEIIEGIRLRHSPNKYCHACRPKRLGTVRRVP